MFSLVEYYANVYRVDMQHMFVIFLTCFSGDFFQHVHQMMVKAGKWCAKRKGNINLQCYSKQQTKIMFK